MYDSMASVDNCLLFESRVVIVVIQNGISCIDCSLLRMESLVVIVVIQNGISFS